MINILFASNNKNKIREIRENMEGCNVYSLEDVGINVDIIEDGETFEKNSLIKATVVKELIRNIPCLNKMIVMAEDSGIEINYLNGDPGVYSARWMPGKSIYEVNEYVIESLKDAVGKERNANYTCVVTLIFPNGEYSFIKNYCYGTIADKQSEIEGFAYDRIFYVTKYQKVMAELSPKEKNEISHRGLACRNALKNIKDSEYYNSNNNCEKIPVRVLNENSKPIVCGWDYKKSCIVFK